MSTSVRGRQTMLTSSGALSSPLGTCRSSRCREQLERGLALAGVLFARNLRTYITPAGAAKPSDRTVVGVSEVLWSPFCAVGQAEP